MIPVKRSNNQTKSNINRYSSKGKDVAKQSTSRQRAADSFTSDSDGPISFPVIKQSDNAKILPRYTGILSRPVDDGVSMDDLDQLQQDFEKLLSTSAVRNRLLRSEVESMDKVEKKGKPIEKSSLKRKRPDEKLKYKDTKNGSRLFKTKQYNPPINGFMGEHSTKHEVPKVILPRNDTSDKFWSSIEPYCADVTKDDVNFLDDLIQECSQDINVKIPEIGEHYAMEWAESTLNQEQNLSTLGKPTKTKSINFSNDLKKSGLNAMVDTFSSPLTQRLLAGLLEEKVLKSYPNSISKLKASDFTLKNNNGPRGGMCLDRRLRKELMEQGILDVDDLPKTFPPEDDILLEIKKCQQELAVVNEHNIKELEKVRTMVAKDLRKQEIKMALSKVDNKVMAMYNTLLTAKQKHVSATDDEEGFDKQNNRLLPRECEEEANKLIKQQMMFHRELSELTNFSMLQ
ncbi:transcriptional adapter 3-A [Onthophagus taurus]|uniref:transcriptional adapter 3-A n=1 Tax=Onthophagus taurus TaxID=166361 RepID=UPI000C2077C9|nr:transcriptional adapter 3-A [Onthophagus taurus]